MTPDQQARLAVAETEIRELRGDIQDLRGEVREANDKLDRIVATMDTGKGVLWVFLKAGVGIAAMVAGATWLANHVRL